MTVSTKSQGFSEETVLVTPRLSCWAAGLAQLSKPAAVSSLNPSAGSDWLITSCPRGAVCWEKPPELLSKEGLSWWRNPGGEIQEEKSWRCFCLCVSTDTEASPLQSEILRGLFPISAMLGCSCCKGTWCAGPKSCWQLGSRCRCAGGDEMEPSHLSLVALQ